MPKFFGKKFEIIPRFQCWSLSTKERTQHSVDSRYDKPFFMGRLMHQPTVNQESVDASTDCKTLHTRESVKRLRSSMAFVSHPQLFSLTIKMEVHHFIFFLRRQNGLKYTNKYVRFLECLIF